MLHAFRLAKPRTIKMEERGVPSGPVVAEVA
jgi:hypothetical protein